MCVTVMVFLMLKKLDSQARSKFIYVRGVDFQIKYALHIRFVKVRACFKPQAIWGMAPCPATNSAVWFRGLYPLWSIVLSPHLGLALSDSF